MSAYRRAVIWLASLLLVGACSAAPATQTVAAVKSADASRAGDRGSEWPVTEYMDPVFGGSYALLETGPTRGRTEPSSRSEGETRSSKSQRPPPPPPVLLVHGVVAEGMVDFAPLIPALARDRKVLAVDLPGFGASSKGNEAYTPDSYTKFLAHVIDHHAGGGPVDVVGHSLGAAIAISLAARHPHQVRRLVSLSVAGILYRETLIYEMHTTHDDQPETSIFALIGRDLWKAGLSLMGALSPEPGTILHNEALRNKVFEGDANQIAALGLLDHDFDDDLRGVRAPTLLVWGAEDDTAPPRTFHVLRERLPVWESHVLPNVGHNLMNLAPQRLLPLVQTFLDSAHLGAFESTRPKVGRQRTGICQSRRAALFEGHYDRIELRGCAEALIRNAVVGSLTAFNSNVELRHVTVENGAVMVDSNLRATGSTLNGDRALVLDASTADLAGVEVVGSRAAVVARNEVNLVSRVSGFTGPRGRVSIHGKRTLQPGERW